jgi:hypothetical protein
MDDCQKFLGFVTVLLCSVACTVGEIITKASGNAIGFSLQIQTMISIFLHRPCRRWHTVRHVMTVKVCNSLQWNELVQ